MKISVDLESRSCVDLPRHGAYNYWADPSTEVICMVYAVDDDEPYLWLPGDPVPEVFLDERAVFAAWNATFERLAFDYYLTPEAGFPFIPLERWRCTMFASRCNNMPARLGNAGRCLGTASQKQGMGMDLINALSKPQPDGTFNKDPALLEMMYDYCFDDVETEREIAKYLRWPSDEEWQDWFVTERMNDRGVRVDVELCRAAMPYAKEEEADLLDKVRELTDDEVTSVRGEGLKQWVLARIDDTDKELLIRYTGGEKKYSLDKANRGRLLDAGRLDDVTRQVVEFSDMAQKSSVGKFKAMEALADSGDQRMRGIFICNGASQTGRHSSVGAQLQNFPRMCAKKPEEVRADLIDGVIAEDIVDWWGMPMMSVLSSMLRPTIVPDTGNKLLSADYSSLENRITAWLIGADERLEGFETGVDFYKIAASSIYDVEVDDVTGDQRQVGKVAELALGYGGGARAFNAMARGYGVTISDTEAEMIKTKWRAANPEYPSAWRELERAFIMAYNTPTTPMQACRVTYFSVEDAIVPGTTVFAVLPDRRVLTYPDVRLAENDRGGYEISVMRPSWTPKAAEKKWPRSHLYGGALLENCAQATASSVLRWAMRELDREGVPVIATIHDQVVVDSSDVARDTAVIERVMNMSPPWAEGLPLAAEVDVLDRFAK